jgi:hypothetical protein
MSVAMLGRVTSVSPSKKVCVMNAFLGQINAFLGRQEAHIQRVHGADLSFRTVWRLGRHRVVALKSSLLSGESG